MNVQTPAARRTDPETSHLAAAHIIANGARGHNQRQAAEAVRNFPGRTSRELAAECKMDRHELARRLPECKRAGAVFIGAVKTCSISGRQALTWWPEPQQVGLALGVAA
jgi:hypothetical protein